MSLETEMPTQIPNSNIEKIEPSSAHITLWNDSGTWKWKDHTAAVPAFTAISGNAQFVVPPCYEVKGFNLQSSNSKATIHYDKRYKELTFRNIIEEFVTGVPHPIRATRIVLDASTTATYIHLHG